MKMTYNLIPVFLVSLSFLFVGCISKQEPTLSIDGIRYAPDDPASSEDYGYVVYKASYSSALYPQSSSDQWSIIRDNFLLDGTPVSVKYRYGSNCVDNYDEIGIGNDYQQPWKMDYRRCEVAVIVGRNDSPSVVGRHTLQICSKVSYMRYVMGIHTDYYDTEVCKTADFNYNP